MERYIAIDNVCAWPNLTLLPNGEIIATIFNQPCHGAWEGDVECWASTDGGRSWRYRGTPAPHDPATNRMNVGAGLTGTGELIVFASGWTLRPTKAEYDAGKRAPFAGSQVLAPWVSRSADGGRTWTIIKAFPPAPEPDMCAVIPFGSTGVAADGSLCISGYCGKLADMRGYNSCYLFRSRDDGRTWGEGAIIGAGGNNETAPLHLGGGRWLAAARKLGQGQGTDLYVSTDDGRTWRNHCVLGLPMQHPAHLLRLADGRVLLVYGNRCPQMWGIDARISADEGQTWGPPLRLIELAHSDLGYPASVQTRDGKVVTAYYLGKSREHHRYHMGVQLWDVEEFFPKPK